LRSRRLCHRPQLTPRRGSSILITVLNFSQRVSVFLVALALSANNVALCAGWMATPEARMACCSNGGACPMHKADSHDLGSPRALSQAEADQCCAASEHDDAAPSASAFALTMSLAVLPSPVPLVTPAAALERDAWRRHSPVPGTHLPRHLLLSVFLV